MRGISFCPSEWAHQVRLHGKTFRDGGQLFINNVFAMGIDKNIVMLGVNIMNERRLYEKQTK